jgi:hypothetical protein
MASGPSVARNDVRPTRTGHFYLAETQTFLLGVDKPAPILLVPSASRHSLRNSIGLVKRKHRHEMARLPRLGKAPRPKARVRLSLAAASIAVALSAPSATTSAFDAGGHSYSVAALYEQAGMNDTERRLETFCAFLPDISEELDAVTQRRNLARSFDATWTIFSVCWGSTSRHMAATHHYLHSLTGGRPSEARSAAESMISDIDRDLTARPQDIQAHANLICERGMAIHLLADTFAHQKDRVTLWSAGTGHADAGHAPDLLLYRPEIWADWLRTASSVLTMGKGRPEELIHLQARLPAGLASAAPDQAELHMLQLLAEVAPLSVQTPPIESWNTDPVATDTMSRLWKDSFVHTPCQDQIDRGPANRSNGRGAPSLSGTRPQCETVWKDYLRRAVPAFVDAGVTPPCHFSVRDAEMDRLGDGR